MLGPVYNLSPQRALPQSPQETPSSSSLSVSTPSSVGPDAQKPDDSGRAVLASDKVSLSSSDKADTSKDTDAEKQSESSDDYTPREEAQIDLLQARDAEVKAHERAHKSVGGQYAGAISYEFRQGPDGKRYAVGGEVAIDTSAVAGDPQATIEKMNVVRAAALAPAEPSAQDRRVAALAAQQIFESRAELNAQSQEGQQGSQSSETDGKGSSLRIQSAAGQTYQAVAALESESDTAKQFVDDIA